MAERAQRSADRGELKFDPQPDFGGFAKPHVWPAQGRIGEPREAFDAYRLAADQFVNRLLDDRNRIIGQYRLDPRGDRLVAAVQRQIALDQLHRQISEGAQGGGVAVSQRPVRGAVDAAEGAVEAAIAQPQRDIEMRGDRQAERDPDRQGRRKFARIMHQFRQFALQHQSAQRFGQGLCIAGRYGHRAVGPDVGKFAQVIDDPRGESDLHPEMAADRIKDAVDRGERARDIAPIGRRWVRAQVAADRNCGQVCHAAERARI